jgi:hypothetical protein
MLWAFALRKGVDAQGAEKGVRLEVHKKVRLQKFADALVRGINFGKNRGRIRKKFHAAKQTHVDQYAVEAAAILGDTGLAKFHPAFCDRKYATRPNDRISAL